MRLVGFVDRARSLAVYVDDIPSAISIGGVNKFYRMIHVTIGKQTVLKVDSVEAPALHDLLDEAVKTPKVEDGD